MLYTVSMTIRIITVGGKNPATHQAIIDDYIKRFPRHIELSWIYIKHAKGDEVSSVTQESEAILKKLSTNSTVILLDETGKQLTSPELSIKLFAQSTYQDVTCIIGGAYGVSDEVKQKANFVWSLSKLVFPHQLVRTILTEQLYRAYTLSIDHPYHHS